MQAVEHGFPPKPSVIAHDPELNLLAVGTSKGLLKMYPWAKSTVKTNRLRSALSTRLLTRRFLSVSVRLRCSKFLFDQTEGFLGISQKTKNSTSRLLHQRFVYDACFKEFVDSWNQIYFQSLNFKVSWFAGEERFQIVKVELGTPESAKCVRSSKELLSAEQFSLLSNEAQKDEEL